MNSLITLKNHLRIFHFFGAWPTETQLTVAAILYHFKTLLLFSFIGLLFPISQLACIFFVETVKSRVEVLVISSSVVVVIMKAINLYSNQMKMLELLHLIESMEKQITKSNHQAKFNCIIVSCRRLFSTYMIAYMCTVSSIVLQAIFSTRDKRSWSSTYHYPYELAKIPAVYFGVLVFQGISNFCICFFAVAADTYGVVLTHILLGHVDVFGLRLREMGQARGGKSADTFYEEIVYCCKSYIHILRLL